MLLSMADVDVQKIPQEISSKYVLENNTLSKPVVTDIEKKIDIEIGDSKQLDFKPQVKTLFFDNEYNVSVRAEERSGAKLELEGEKVKYITDEYEVHLYDKSDAGENGGHEIEWLLPKKPKSNILRATLLYKGNVKFCYQPELTQVEINDGCVRPENVVGSYAVYIDKSNHKLNGKNYATGKIEHIYRPQAIDANGNKTWCELYIPESGQADIPINITVTIPQKFLDEAVYPIVVDPTFGYTTVGGSTYNTSSNTIYGTGYTIPESLTIDSLTFNCNSSVNIKGIVSIFVPVTWDLATNGVSPSANCSSGWNTLNYSSKPSLLLDDSVVIGIIGDTGTGFKYDSNSGFTRYIDTSNSYTTPANPGSFSTTSNQQFSIYATYTSSATSSIKKIMGVAIASVKKVSSLAIASVKKVMGVSNV